MPNFIRHAMTHLKLIYIYRYTLKGMYASLVPRSTPILVTRKMTWAWERGYMHAIIHIAPLKARGIASYIYVLHFSCFWRFIVKYGMHTFQSTPVYQFQVYHGIPYMKPSIKLHLSRNDTVKPRSRLI